MSQDEISAILRAPRKVILVLIAALVGGGSFGFVYAPYGGDGAAVAECRVDLERALTEIARLEDARIAVPGVQRMESWDSTVSDMLGRGRQ